MREIFFKKVLIKSVTLIFSVLVWGQPALGCDDWRRDRTCDLRPEIKKIYGDRNVALPVSGGMDVVKGHDIK